VPVLEQTLPARSHASLATRMTRMKRAMAMIMCMMTITMMMVMMMTSTGYDMSAFATVMVNDDGKDHVDMNTDMARN
jgi:hypothetical protein